MLSATSDYALRAILLLARAHGTQPIRADEIADEIGAPRNYLAKMLNALAKGGLVTSARGPLGGFSLAIAPAALSLAAVVDLFDEPRPHERCMLGSKPCDPTHPCSAHARWTALRAARRAPLATTTFADLLDDTPTLPRASPAAPSVDAFVAGSA